RGTLRRRIGYVIDKRPREPSVIEPVAESLFHRGAAIAQFRYVEQPDGLPLIVRRHRHPQIYEHRSLGKAIDFARVCKLEVPGARHLSYSLGWSSAEECR